MQPSVRNSRRTGDTMTRSRHVRPEERGTMATIVTPRKRARLSRKWVIGIVVAVIVLAGIAAFVMLRGANGTTATETPGWTTAAANTGTIDAAVSATGSVEAQAQADLRFAADGTVTAILVKPGQLVQAG